MAQQGPQTGLWGLLLRCGQLAPWWDPLRYTAPQKMACLTLWFVTLLRSWLFGQLSLSRLRLSSGLVLIAGLVQSDRQLQTVST